MHAWIDEMGISLYRILVTQHMSERGGERDLGTDWMNCRYGPAKPKISMRYSVVPVHTNFQLLPFEGIGENPIERTCFHSAAHLHPIWLNVKYSVQFCVHLFVWLFFQPGWINKMFSISKIDCTPTSKSMRDQSECETISMQWRVFESKTQNEK